MSSQVALINAHNSIDIAWKSLEQSCQAAIHDLANAVTQWSRVSIMLPTKNQRNAWGHYTHNYAPFFELTVIEGLVTSRGNYKSYLLTSGKAALFHHGNQPKNSENVVPPGLYVVQETQFWSLDEHGVGSGHHPSKNIDWSIAKPVQTLSLDQYDEVKCDFNYALKEKHLSQYVV